MEHSIYLIPIITPVIVFLVRKKLPKLPKELLPVVAAMVGPLLDSIAALTTTHESNTLLAVALGLAGVGLRETKKQLLSTPSS